MRPLECENFLCFALQTADKVACGYFFLFSNPPFTLNEHQAGQFWPALTDPSQIFRIRYRPTPSCLNASMAFIDGFRIVIGGIFEILALNTAQMVMRMMSNNLCRLVRYNRGSSGSLNMIENVLSSILHLRFPLCCRFLARYLDAIVLMSTPHLSTPHPCVRVRW